jgi:hypothetical protein
MGIFVCDKCNCIENTALGLYWTKNYTEGNSYGSYRNYR